MTGLDPEVVIRSARALWDDESAPTSTEYAVMLGGIAIAIFTMVGALGQSVVGLFRHVVTTWAP